MRCPFCNNDDTQVKDSRPAEDNSSIRRRRFCTECGARFTTFERVQLRDMIVIKADDKRQPFDREKIIRSMHIALRKRPVDSEQVEKTVNAIVRQLESMGESEIPSSQIGELVMHALARLDQVGYIRYASVYKDFCKPQDFNEFLEELKDLQTNKTIATE
ncbi:MAG TPA: transcriptional regulator NrdR [Alphaproteobacteria bacterium]|jgi:transcriptional repressor NrdR